VISALGGGGGGPTKKKNKKKQKIKKKGDKFVFVGKNYNFFN